MSFGKIISFFRQIVSFLKNPEDMHKLILKLAEESEEEFVPILLNPFDPMLLVKDASILHLILKDVEFQNRSSFPIIDYIYFQFIKNLNSLENKNPKIHTNMGGITFTNGEEWKRNRKIGLTVMNDPIFLEKSIEPILNSIDAMLLNLKEKKTQFAISDELSLLGIDVVGKLVFNIDLELFSKEKRNKNQIDSYFLTSSVRVMLDAIQKYIYYPFPAFLFSFFKTKDIRNLDRAVSNLALAGNTLLSKVKEDLQLGNSRSESSIAGILLQKYPDLEDTEIQTLLMDLLGAGHDTTANLVIFTLSSILESNVLETSKELQKEIASIVEILPSFQKANENIDSKLILEKIEKNTPILSSILNESLRLFPLGAVFSRITFSKKEIHFNIKDKEYILKPKSKLLVSPYVTGRLKKDWGRSANEFDPFRFLDKEKGNAFIPFGSGKRSCIGARFGILEAKLILFRLFQIYKIEKGESFQKTDSILAFTLRAKNPIWVLAKANT
ncbi:MAG TPA: cytochrome P450 [Leptospiraceae bacterium]|nr:cytochrome P450 [Leptospiraceae bacterium]HNC00058.1 cytochrome P450 [Leptospiraceae bacterium]HNE10898.1 cytochrome P450 [Leptospiraceae bacterium]HNH01133.1 cytochrome P450 [Leptospiraceae bacterium]HNI88121.1 cytochrome P450 [Leptospiraceae bacterium]